ncbi:DUF3224 domain-containing protein [Hymenobacter gummosus]|uniref:DUF3224 domain-containing protein n=1 Tax=Hymenobacter gummosus TaxID=1776032 RepID=A0A3S0IKF8_9BACT|nr:DUF3224 domain-containing protein [Hymenobacter gummosus]RTQ46513.1 DUF3224 domain-containing protein [Hymenobacter gummosus]
MNERALSTLELETWREQACHEIDGQAVLARASATQHFRGDIEGTGQLEVLLTYHPDGSASSVGLERVVGRVGGRAGSFVLEHTGSVEDGVSKANLAVVPGSGTQDLGGLRGRGWVVRRPGRSAALTLEYEFLGP